MVVALVAALMLAAGWLFGLDPIVLTEELVHPVRPGIAVTIRIDNGMPKAFTHLIIAGPSRELSVGPLPAGQARTIKFRDTRYGDLVLEDRAAGARFVILGADTRRTGFAGTLGVHLDDKLNAKAAGSVFGERLRYAPRQWRSEEGVWPLSP